MSKVIIPQESSYDKRMQELNGNEIFVTNGYNVQRIVYELIKNYMLSNSPEDCGVQLKQRFNADPVKSDIKLDVAYNWKAADMDKVPAVYVQRGDIEVGCPTMGQDVSHNEKESEDTRLSISQMPVIITCIAAEPVAVVENLVEYVKQALICFRKEVKLDFRLRRFQLSKITKPEQTKESKNNFKVDLVVDTAFDETWVIKREGLRLKTVGMVIFDGLTQTCHC
jgi:hypothetical protein